MHEPSEDQFNIVEEHEDVITVSAADLKTQDELQFIQKLQNPEVDCCSKCLTVFKNPIKLAGHIKRNCCVPKQKCPICPLTFIDAQSLVGHLKLHKENNIFCSQYCGASFRTLPLCEEHEKNEHKLNNAPKIRYKHFCSFCREGFKTELQLHVHWLQQKSQCRKLMLNIATHLNKTANNNKDDGTPKSTTVKQQNPHRVEVSPTACSNFPLTKLRLKSNVQSNTNDNNKRHQKAAATLEDQNEKSTLKRMKIVDDLKARMTQSPDKMLMDFNSDIKIKEEPLDEDDILNNTPPIVMPEVIIKTEDEIKEEPMEDYSCSVEDNTSTRQSNEMKSLLLNNNKIMNPDFNGKIIPLLSQQTTNTLPADLKQLTPNTNTNTNTNNNNTINANNFDMNSSLKNITNLKLVRLTPSNISSTAILPNNLQISSVTSLIDTKFQMLPKDMPLRLVRILPSTQYLSFKTNPNNIPNEVNKNESVVMKLQPLQQVQALPMSVTLPNSITITPVNPNHCNTNATANVNSILGAVAPPLPPPLPTPSEGVLELNKMLANKTIDSEDFKKLQSEAFRKAEELRKKYISKKSLIAIDSLPEKKQLIASLKQQIAQVETPGDSSLVKDSNVTTNALFKKAAEGINLNTKNVNEPATLYLPIWSAVDVELVEARYQHPNYTYKWICPYCLKDYEIKRCLKSHLVKAHHLTNRDLEKINAQAKPFLNTEVTVESQVQIKEEAEEILSDSLPSDDVDSNLSMPLSSNARKPLPSTAIAPPPPEPIKMSALKMNKPRYVCEKCGRKCSSKTMLNDHMMANCSREPQYPCKVCPKKFYSESTLRCHVTIHTGELPHKCNYCEKRFRTRGQVTVHHRTHTGERPFVCQVCTQRFTHRETLIAHLSRHIGMKRYKCYCCDKHFSCISALKTHREIRPDTCGKVKFNPRAIGPRVRVVRGNVIFEAQPEINPYLKSEDPKVVLAELQNQLENDVK